METHGHNRSLQAAQDGIFDTIVMMGNNFGLMGGASRATWLLRRMHSITSTAGRIVATSTDVYATSDPSRRGYQRANLARGRMAASFGCGLRYRDLATRWFDYLIVSPAEMKRLLRGTGWAASKWLTSSGSPRYCVVIEKA